MAPPRLKAEFWIKAHLRICAANDVAAVVVRRGEETAGSVLLKLNLLDGRAIVLEPTLAPGGGRAWMRLTGREPVAEAQANDAIRRAVARDPDLWVVEIEDRAGRSFLGEPEL